MDFFPKTRGAQVRAGVLSVLCIVAPIGLLGWMIPMPGASHAGPPAPDASDAERAARLRATVTRLGGELGERNDMRSQQLAAAAEHIERAFAVAGFSPTRETVNLPGRTVDNVVAERRGETRPDEVVLVGAHYDSVDGSPGADDNASGVAGLLELAAALGSRASPRTLRLVAFTNEEPPHFQTATMGSRVHADGSRRRGEHIVGMISLESIGYFLDAPGSQGYPFPLGLFYPDRGDFVAFVGNLQSRSFVRAAVERFRATARVASAGLAAPELIKPVGWSDHWSFWQNDYPALMVTDTAPFRNPNYHHSTDLPDTLDYDRMTQVVRGVEAIVVGLLDARE